MENPPFKFRTYQKHWAGEQSTLADFAFLEAAPSMSLGPQFQQERARA